jgi:hypothetical protein
MLRLTILFVLGLGTFVLADEPPAHTHPPKFWTGGGRFFEESPPLEDGSWVVKECLSDGTCKYYNRKTGELRLVKRSEAPNPAKKDATEDTAVKQAGHAEKKNAALTDEEKKLLDEPSILDLADFKSRLPIAKRDGKRFLILQVGNLAGCPPCQQINRQLQASELAKDKTVGIYEFNYLNGGAKMKELLHQIGLPAQFGFPYVYIFEVDEKGEWISRYSKLDRDGAMKVENVKAAIDSFKRSAEPLKK